MTLKQYILTMTVVTLFCWCAWFFILWTVNPEITNWIGFTLFYTSLFLALAGTAAVVGFIIRFIIFKEELVYRLVKEAFRQSFLFAALVIVSLILLAQDLFSWLNMLLLVIGLSALEFFILSWQKQNKM
ncbi:MAG: hypothetical protein BWY51_00773 [Parcubacteria group bacterium ADurb.Bin316]|mgnify:CR=1 FL=1|nr:MAG: hypothetical protein BWY51_00773 [Parcubacteria group bacterium ADurb.Bin316]